MIECPIMNEEEEEGEGLVAGVLYRNELFCISFMLESDWSLRLQSHGPFSKSHDLTYEQFSKNSDTTKLITADLERKLPTFL